MFGLPGFILTLLSLIVANLYLLIAVGAIIFARKGRKKFPWRTVIPLLLFQAVVSPLILPRYYHQIENYIFLRTVTANEVISIQIDSMTWTAHQDIETIINSLNQAVWHESNHDSGGPFVTMTMELQSGKKWQVHIGRYYEKSGAMFEFFHPLNDEGAYRYDGTAYIPELTITLQRMGYSLPFE